METFTSVATWLQATGPYGLVAVLGWAFWRVNEEGRAAPRAVRQGGRDGARADRGRDQVEAALVALKDAIEDLHDKAA